MERIDWQIDIADAMRRLTRRQREALALWLAGYTYADVGRAFGIRRNSARDRICRAISRLKNTHIT